MPEVVKIKIGKPKTTPQTNKVDERSQAQILTDIEAKQQQILDLLLELKRGQK